MTTTETTPGVDQTPGESPALKVGDLVQHAWIDPTGPKTRLGRVHKVTPKGVIVEWLELAGPIPTSDGGLSRVDDH